MKLRSMVKSKKKMLISESKFYKNPVMIQKSNKATILFSHSNIGVSQNNSKNDKIFLFSENREKPLNKISYNDKMKKMKINSDSRAYFHTPNSMYPSISSNNIQKKNSRINKSLGVNIRRTSGQRKSVEK